MDALTLPSGVADFLQVTLGGLATGGLYAVLLFGVLLVFQVSKNLNFAYGQTGMLGAFGSYFLYTTVGIPPLIAVILGAVVSILISALTGYVIVRRLPEGNGLDLVVTLGLLLLLTAVAQIAFGIDARTYLPLLSKDSVIIAGVYVNGNDVLAILLGLGTVVAGHYLINRTGLGVSLRAAAANEVVARSVGIDVVRLRTLVWAGSGLLAAVGAMMFASQLSVDAFYMTPITINVFIVGMIGGLDRFWPPMFLAFGIAVYQSWSVFIFGPDAGVPALFILVVGLIALAPRRFVEERYEARA
jgi:branched-chain amino acid transport system permease protein